MNKKITKLAGAVVFLILINIGLFSLARHKANILLDKLDLYTYCISHICRNPDLQRAGAEKA